MQICKFSEKIANTCAERKFVWPFLFSPKGCQPLPPWPSKHTFGQKFHNVSVTDGPPAKQIGKIELFRKEKLLLLLEHNNFTFQSCSIFQSVWLVGRQSRNFFSPHFENFAHLLYMCDSTETFYFIQAK